MWKFGFLSFHKLILDHIGRPIACEVGMLGGQHGSKKLAAMKESVVNISKQHNRCM